MKTMEKEKKTTLETRERIDLLPIEDILKKPYLNERETSVVTGLSEQTLRNDRHLRKGLPYCKIGERKIMYKMADVICYMEKNRISF